MSGVSPEVNETDPNRRPTNAAGDAIGRVSQVSDPVVVLRHEDEIVAP